jgi:hypothetical protein
MMRSALLILAQLASTSADCPTWCATVKRTLDGQTRIRLCGCHTTEVGGAAAGHVRLMPHGELRTYGVHRSQGVGVCREGAYP